jgi:TolA-binding protein
MSDDRLRELAKDLPWERPDPGRRDAVRSALLVAASEEGARPRRRWHVLGGAFAAGALAATAIGIVVVRDPGSSPAAPLATSTGAAQITASSSARLDHQVVASGTGVDEIVHVHDGTVRLAIGEVHRGDHVRLRTGDAEVEGAGEYEVVVLAEALRAVTVRTGSAQITVNGQRTVLLAAGQTWRASIITTEVLPIPPVQPPADDLVAHPPEAPSSSSQPAVAVRRPDSARAPTVRVPDVTPGKQPAVRSSDSSPDQPGERRSPALVIPEAPEHLSAGDTGPGAGSQAGSNSVPRPPRTVSEIERRFQAGWALLRSGQAREAAAELEAAANTSPDDPLAADARYFQAVALVRAGQRPDAERVLVAFLDHAPRSLRRGRAAVLLGRLIGERGGVASARAWLESAVTDPDPAVAAAARAGLAALPPQPTR